MPRKTSPGWQLDATSRLTGCGEPEEVMKTPTQEREPALISPRSRESEANLQQCQLSRNLPISTPPSPPIRYCGTRSSSLWVCGGRRRWVTERRGFSFLLLSQISISTSPPEGSSQCRRTCWLLFFYLLVFSGRLIPNWRLLFIT